MNKDPRTPIVGISSGDSNGVGPEVIIKTLSDPRILNYCTPVIFACKNLVNYYAKTLEIKEFNYNATKNINNIIEKKINVFCDWNTQDELLIEPGLSTKTGGNYAVQSLNLAVSHLKKGMIDVVVTGPINKGNVQSPDFQYRGHTEYFTQMFGANGNLMLMVYDEVRIGVATGHMPLSEVLSKITKENLRQKIEIFQKSLIEDFNKMGPNIAILGLNPHASDDGLLGSEENEVIIPLINEMNKKGYQLFGPYPADGFFGNHLYLKFDGVLAMYHDQGLIPFKTIAFEKGVNFTAGLPIIRTSPAHGTAYSLAGKGEANENSFREALLLAIKIFKNRNDYHEATKDTLKSRFEKEKEIEN